MHRSVKVGSLATAVASLVLTFLVAAPAHADDEDFIAFLEQHGLGCGEGSIKCKSPADLIQMGHAACYDMDVNGQTPTQAAEKLVDIGEGFINRIQADALVAASIVNYCPWDKSEIPGEGGDGT
jgi:hypothetical protein